MSAFAVLLSLIFLNFLGFICAICWCSYLSGQIRGLTGDIRPKPGLFREILRPKTGQSALHTPRGYGEDEAIGLRPEEDGR